MRTALNCITRALGCLKGARAGRRAATRRSANAPTPQQGQFLAYIREYLKRNETGVAPSQADLRRFFNLSAPSVSSMMARLEERGFIRRVPGKTRAITLTIRPELIPPLERRFKF